MTRKFPFSLIFLAYLSILGYFCVFRFSWFLLIIFLISLLTAFVRKYYLLFPILALLLGFFYLIAQDEKAKMSENMTEVHQILPIADTIEVNGDKLSFRGKSGKNIYQLYYTLTNQTEKEFFKKLDKNVQITFEGELSKPESQRNFNGFDYKKYLATQNIYWQIKIKKIERIENSSSFDLHLLRRKAIVWSQSHFPAPMSNYVTGLLFGYLGKDFQEMEGIYGSLGIIHLFALSGMQVNFFIDWLRKLLLRLGLSLELVNLFQIPFSIFYAFLTGLSVSVLRALLQKNIRCSGLDNFSATLLLLFFIQPKYLLTVGGQLTMLYAFVIVMLSGRFTKLGGVKKILLESSLISVMVLPLLLFYFHVFQPFSIILTVIFGFLFDTLLLPLLLFSFLLSLLGIFLPVNFIFLGLEQIIALVGNLLPNPPVFGKPSDFVLIILLIFIALFVDFFHLRKWRWTLFLGVCLLFFLIKNPLSSTITMIDVGQGDSILLQEKWGGKKILIDTGGRVDFKEKEDWQSVQTQANAEKTLIPYLHSLGIGQLDALILTHTDDDHIGDLLALTDRIKVKEIWLSKGALTNPDFVKKLRKTKSSIHLAEKGEQIPIFNSQLQILSSGFSGKGDNDDSIVTYGQFYGKKFLFTGDLEKSGEEELMKNYPQLRADVLKAGHHGSKTSSSPEFIEQISPQLALISVGKNNPYHHPNPEILERFQKNQVRVLRSDQNGAIKLTEKWGRWEISTVK